MQMINAPVKTQHKAPYAISDLSSKFYGGEGQLTPLTQPSPVPANWPRSLKARYVK